ncbi:hypothetical protein GCM10011354_21440 [Egicoccus halophilus]|uniref:Uncharacterized protein n=1 Tax=Egicoccus halophilus TaxID=1670830 RepID=A0A8J3AFL8_9ACTN|nr:hypothetical protein GCM10011354_21440 [Egicoccus halophilus]
MDGGDHRRHEADRRRECRDRDGEQVGRHGGERHRAEGGQQQRHDGDLRPQRDRQQVRDPARHPPQAPPDEGRDDEDSRGGGRRQQQSERAGQPRVEQHQQHRGARECMTGVARMTTRPGEQDDPGHGARPQHGGLEAGEEREPRQGRRQHDPSQRGRQAQHETRPEHPGGHQRDMGPRHRREVGEGGCLHRRAVDLGQFTGVPGGQAGEQSSDRRRRAPGSGTPNPVADVFADPRPHSTATELVPAADVERDGGVLAGQPPAVPAVGERAGRRPGGEPRAEGRRVVGLQRGGRPLAGDGPIDARDTDDDVPTGRDPAWFVHDRAGQLRLAALVRQRRQQPPRRRRHARGARRDPHGEHRHEQPPTDRRGTRRVRPDDRRPTGARTGPSGGTRVVAQGASGGHGRTDGQHGGERDPRPRVRCRPEVLPDRRPEDQRDRPQRQRAEHLAGRWSTPGGLLGVAHDTVTRSASCWKVFSPMPGTSRRSPGTAKGPCSSR